MPMLASFDDIVQAFRTVQGPTLPVALGAVGLVVVVSFGAFVRARRSRDAEERRSDQAFELALDKRRLEPAERNVAQILARYVPERPRRSELLASSRVFQAAVERALREQTVSDEEVAALRIRLGFRAPAADRTVHSTAELTPELAVIVEQGNVRRFRAHTESVDAASITIVTDDGEVPPAPGSALQVYFKRASGVFTFESRVLSLEGSRVRIAHSERIGRYQKRRYFRRKLAMPVLVRVAGSEEKPSQYRFLDLGGGGASITNPELRFRPGDDIEIKFRPGTNESIGLVGEVVRLSEAGKVMHISFGPIQEAMRDRIIGFILNVGKKA